MKRLWRSVAAGMLTATVTATETGMPPPGSSPQDTCIAVIGSSTVWGKGLLGEGSLVGTLDEHLRDRWSRMVQPEAMRFPASRRS